MAEVNATTARQNSYGKIADIASAQPENVAIIDGSTELSFRALVANTDAYAAELAGAGTLPGDRVALIAESGAEYLIVALAVWKLGAVLVTIYPSSSDVDILNALAASDPVIAVVSEKRLVPVIRERFSDLPVAELDRSSLPNVRRTVRANTDDLREPLALICFSSGTTSTPKAIMLSAATVYNAAATYAEVWHLSLQDRALISLPMAWLYGLLSTSLAVLFGGGTVVVARRGRPEILVGLALRHRVTFIAGVTVTFAKIVRYANEHDIREAFSGLRFTISGGEPRNEKVFGEWRQLTGSPVLDAYCASECIPLFTYDPTVDPEPRMGSGGKLVPRQEIKIVDTRGEPVASGEVGELLARGPGLMLGYWGDPGLTKEAFTDDGWYRMKDLVRMDEEGFVYVVGRLSDLIIRGGTNISPLEIETTLNDHPSVAQSAVVGLPDEQYGQRIVAVVVTRNDELTADELHRFAAERLSGYKIPGAFHMVNEIPTNATTSKADKKKIVEMLLEGDPFTSPSA